MFLLPCMSAPLVDVLDLLFERCLSRSVHALKLAVQAAGSSAVVGCSLFAVPLFQRIEDKHGVDEPGYEPPPLAADDPSPRTQPKAPQPALWRRVVRVVVFVLLLADAWPLFLKKETTVGEAPASEIVVGVLLTLVAMAWVGSFSWFIRRIRRSPRTWWQSTFTVPVMLITLIVGVGGYAGRRRNEGTKPPAKPQQQPAPAWPRCGRVRTPSSSGSKPSSMPSGRAPQSLGPKSVWPQSRRKDLSTSQACNASSTAGTRRHRTTGAASRSRRIRSSSTPTGTSSRPRTTK